MTNTTSNIQEIQIDSERKNGGDGGNCLLYSFFNKLSISALSIFRFVGIALFVIIPIVMLYDWLKGESVLSLLAPFAITTSALIAGFSVEKSILTTKQMKEEDRVKNIEKAQKIVRQIIRHLVLVAKEQQKGLKEGLPRMLQSSLSREYFYSDLVMQHAIIEPLEKLTDADIIGVLKPEVASKLYEVKYETLNIVHQYNILKSLCSQSRQAEIVTQADFVDKGLTHIIKKYESEINDILFS